MMEPVPSEPLGRVLPLPRTLPVDILHVSDLHWGAGKGKGDPFEDCWASFLSDVGGQIREGKFRPSFIAFTGDLVHSAGIFGLKHFRQGVNALLDLAGRCGFVEGKPTWRDKEVVPPPAWWALLNRRLFVVPGNHDFYPLGLRMLWRRRKGPWIALSVPRGEAPASAVLSGPLAVLLIDSNGKPSAFGAARGEVEKPASLRWPEVPAPDQFRIALMHGHPLQVPFLLRDFESEQLMLIENSGLLLSNLARLGVRLVLHGHRHYPSVSTLSLPDSDGGTQPIVVVGAGSVTRLPGKWQFYSYDWIRIHPDYRVEVTREQRAEGGNGFQPAAVCLADAGDFRFDLVRKEVIIRERTGDLDVTVRIAGLRVLPGRHRVARIPSPFSREEFADRAAFRSASKGVRWDDDASCLRIDPPCQWDSPPVDLELQYYIHNGVALSRWEANELYGEERSEGSSLLISTCQAGTVELQVRLPPTFFTSKEEDFAGRVLNELGDEDLAASSSFTFGSGALRWTPSEAKVSARRERPQSSCMYQLRWRLPEAAPAPEEERLLLVIRYWQKRLLDEHVRGGRPLDAKCNEIARSLDTRGLSNMDVSLFLPDTNELHQPPVDVMAQPKMRGALRLVGSTRPFEPPSTQWSPPYGVGVAGRAWRAGTPQLYDVTKAQTSRKGWERGETTLPPQNFYRPTARGPEYVTLLAVPILATVILAKKLNQDEDRGRLAMLVLSIGSSSPSSLLIWDQEKIASLIEEVVPPLEQWVYGELRGSAETGG